MKKSGLRWSPEVPAHWTVKKLGFVTALNSGEAITSDDIKDAGPYPVYGGNGLRGFADAFTHDGHFVLVGRQGALCGNINYGNGRFWASEHALVATPREAIEVTWLGELLRTMNLNQFSVSAAQPGLSVDIISALKIPVPPLSEQASISAFLARETKQIDALLNAKERLRELLDEKRRTFIQCAVIRGMNRHARMKVSGHAWLGEIPAHWEVKRSKRVFTERDDRSETGEEELLTVSHITGVTKRSEKDVNMFEAESNEGYKKCSPGNLVINTLWAWMGAMGVSPEEGIVSPAYHVYELSDEILPGYVDALVRTPAFTKEVTRFSTGVWSSRLRLYPEGLFEVRIPVPPISEQKEIVAAIEKERARTREFESALRKSIDLLKERRAALITAAVTGQIPLEEMTQ